MPMAAAAVFWDVSGFLGVKRERLSKKSGFFYLFFFNYFFSAFFSFTRHIRNTIPFHVRDNIARFLKTAT